MERNSRDDAAETVVGVAGVLTAGGVLTFALFPLLLPTVVLLGILALPLLPVALLGAVLWPLYLLSRGAVRAMRGRRAQPATATTASISTRAPFGSAATPTTARAGGSSVKNAA